MRLPQFSFYIPAALAKTFFFPRSLCIKRDLQLLHCKRLLDGHFAISSYLSVNTSINVSKVIKLSTKLPNKKSLDVLLLIRHSGFLFTGKLGDNEDIFQSLGFSLYQSCKTLTSKFRYIF